VNEVYWIEKARKGEVTLPEPMTKEEDEWYKKYGDINLPFIRRWAKEPQAAWEKKKKEILAKRMTPEQHHDASVKALRALTKGEVE
jgi:hypothetical protein